MIFQMHLTRFYPLLKPKFPEINICVVFKTSQRRCGWANSATFLNSSARFIWHDSKMESLIFCKMTFPTI